MKFAKRILSLVLVMLMLISCIVFVGCEDDIPADLEGYSEISPEDEAVVRMVASRFNYWNLIPDSSLISYDIVADDDFVSKINSSTHSLYKTQIKTDDHYYICGYGSELLSTLAYMTCGDGDSMYEWYRVDDFDLIRESVGGKGLMHIFLVRDAVIERNVMSGETVGSATKYYDYYRGSDKNELKARDLGNGTYLLYLKRDLVESGEPLCISSYTIHLGYDMYIDGEGTEYLVFLNEVCDKEGKTQSKSRDLFAEYYDALSEHFAPMDSIGNDTLHYAGIEVGTLVEIVVE